MKAMKAMKAMKTMKAIKAIKAIKTIKAIYMIVLGLTLALQYANFEDFFRYGSYCVPPNVEVLSVTLTEGLLTLDVSAEILSYEGSAFEYAMVTQLVEIATNTEGASHFTLKINGAVGMLKKGTVIEELPLRGTTALYPITTLHPASALHPITAFYPTTAPYPVPAQ